jgi:hypothetical protein
MYSSRGVFAHGASASCRIATAASHAVYALLGKRGVHAWNHSSFDAGAPALGVQTCGSGKITERGMNIDHFPSAGQKETSL